MDYIYFVEAQGFLVRYNIVYQDNEITILLPKNERSIQWEEIIYFFITDRIEGGNWSLAIVPQTQL